MKPRVNIITVGVGDLKVSLAFYREVMGWTPWWPPPGHQEPVNHAAFELHGGLSLVLNPRDELAPVERAGRFIDGIPDFSLTHVVASREAVDALLARARAAGAAVIGDPVEHPWGYAGQIRDPDGHVWEIMWNPDFKPGA